MTQRTRGRDNNETGRVVGRVLTGARRCGALVAVVAAVASASVTVATVVESPPAALAAPPLTCGGNTIYGLNQHDPHSLLAIDTTTGATTLAGSFPSGVPGPNGSVNGLAISANGAAAYAVQQTYVTANTVAVYKWDPPTDSATQVGSITVAAADTNIVMGGINPVNGLYYIGVYNTTSNPSRFDFYAYNTTTNTSLGLQFTITYQPTNPATFNGDLVFDSTGRMYVVMSAGNLVADNQLVYLDPPLPTSGGVATPTLITTLNPSGAAFQGITFGADGYLYTQATTGTDKILRKLDPNTGAVVSTVTITNPGGGTNTEVGDLASCTYNSTITVVKNIVGRAVSTDQFRVQITATGLNQNNVGITAGTDLGLQTADAETAGPVVGVPDRVYAIDELAQSGTVLTNYVTSWSCLNNTTGLTLSSGSGTSGSVTMPSVATIGATGAQIVCTFTNTPQPLITVNKALGSARVVNTNQFTTNIRTGSATGTVVNSTTSSTSTGTGSTVTAGTGTTGAYRATAGTTYYLNESAAGTTNLAQYNATITCTDSAGLQTGLPTGAALGTALQITPVAGANISCTITNSVAPPQITLTKTLGSSRVNAGDQFTVTVVADTTGVRSSTAFDCSLDNGEAGTGLLNLTTAIPNIDSGSASLLRVEAFGMSPTATACVEIPIIADLSLTKRAGVTTVSVGGTVHYTIVLTNGGPHPSTSVEATDTLPAALTLVGGSVTTNQGTAAVSGQMIVWTVGTVEVGQSFTLEYDAVVNTVGSLTNTVEVTKQSGHDPDSTPDNHVNGEDDQSDSIITATVDVLPPPTTPPSTGPLPSTGTDPTGPIELAGIFVGVGVFALLIRRRRRSAGGPGTTA